MQAYSSEQLASIAARIKDVKFGMLTTSDDMRTLTSRPLKIGDRDDVGMSKRGRCQCFATKTLYMRRIAGGLGIGDDFHELRPLHSLAIVDFVPQPAVLGIEFAERSKVEFHQAAALDPVWDARA